jgi:hypothetical protein
VVGGTPEAPETAYLQKPLPVTEDPLKLAGRLPRADPRPGVPPIGVTRSVEWTRSSPAGRRPPASRYAHDSPMTAKSAVMTTTRSRLITASSVAAMGTVLTSHPIMLVYLRRWLFCATSTPAPSAGHVSSHAVSLDLSRTKPPWL